jgi:Raf kinase inhibitor-like YbhB/YbcL family protein
MHPGLALALALAVLAPSLASSLGPAAAASMAVSSPAFPDGGAIPERYTCLGANVSPPLEVGGAPPGTVSLALVMADPDAPLSLLRPLGLVNFTHWLVWNVPVADGGAHFPEDGLPAGAVESAAYTGPCPPVPLDPHHYHFEVHALDAVLDLEPGATREQLEAAMQGHDLGQATLVGTFARPLPLP